LDAEVRREEEYGILGWDLNRFPSGTLRTDCACTCCVKDKGVAKGLKSIPNSRQPDTKWDRNLNGRKFLHIIIALRLALLSNTRLALALAPANLSNSK
jgi:hypothetical protein